MRRTYQRLFLILLLLGIVAGSAMTFVETQRRQLYRQLEDQRQLAVEAVRHGRFDQALPLLREYSTHRQAMDVDTLYHFALAEQGLDLPGDDHMVRAERLLRRVVARQPNHFEAQRTLLAVQEHLRFELEAIETADRVLRLSPAYPEALRIKAKALVRLERFDEAMEIAKQWVDVEPESVAAHALVLDILHRGPWPAQRVTGYAQAQRQLRPNDVRFEVLLCRAGRLAHNPAYATKTMLALAHGPLPAPEPLELLVEELEAAGMFDESLALLRRAAEVYDQPWIKRTLVRRLWARGHDEELIAHTGGFERIGPEDDAEMLALKAMAMLRRGRSYWTEPIMAELERRESDRRAQAWAICVADLKAQADGDDDEVAEGLDAAIERGREAARLDPSNPCIRLHLGDRLRDSGALLEAIESWSAAAEAAPYWAEPRLRLSQAMIELGLGHQAMRFATEAKQRDPNVLPVRVMLAMAHGLSLQQGEGNHRELLELVRSIQHEQPGEPRTLPLYAALLAQHGEREEASNVLLSALEQSPAEATLIHLARVSQEHGLGLTEAMFAQSEQLYGRTPQLIQAHAWHRWRRGRMDQALAELMTLASDETGAADSSFHWRLAQVRFLDAIGSPQAIAGWQEMAEQQPNRLALHQEILQARTVQNDRRMKAEAITRLHALTGDDGLTWRLAQARWLLESDSPTDEQAVQAAMLLGEVVRRVPELVQPRLLLARSFTQLDNPQLALMHLRKASDLAPHSTEVALELARLLTEQGEADEVMALLDGVVVHPDATTEQLQDAAALFVQLQRWDQAAAALTRAVEVGANIPNSLVFVEPIVPRSNAPHAPPPTAVVDER